MVQETVGGVGGVGGVDRHAVMQCFREHYRRCGRGEPRKGAGNNDVSCGCVLDGEDKTPHHELVSTFVEKLRAWAAKRPSKEEQGLIGRLAKYQGKRNQEPAAVAAILKGEGIVVNEAKIKCKKEWSVTTLNPSFFGWVAKEGAEVSSGVGDAGGAGGAAASGGGVQVRSPPLATPPPS